MTDKPWQKRKANLDDLKNVREYIHERLITWDVDASSIYDLVMAATEAMTNIILHGYHGQPGPVKVDIQNDGNDIAIILRDQAAPFDPGSASHPDIKLPLEQRPLGGVGIFLMQGCMDQIIHEVLPHGGNELTLIKKTLSVPRIRKYDMDLIIEKTQGRVPVTILGLKGDLDASNFQEVIEKAKDIFSSGDRNLLLDMSQLKFLSSSGIVALHSIALIMRGDQPHDLEGGWNTLHAIKEDRSSGKQDHVKLLNPGSKIHETLHKTGMDAFFGIFYDLNAALASF